MAPTMFGLAPRPFLALPAMLAGLGLLAACTMLPDEARAPGEAPRNAPPAAESREGRQCLAALAATGAVFTPLPDRAPQGGCSALNSVQLSSVPSDGGRLMIGNLGPATCGVTSAFAGWARYGADRAARQILGSPLRSIETFGSYSCRNVAGSGRRSAHATAEAIDVSAFVLADGRRITVLGDWEGGSESERAFLRTVQRSACRRFATVLGPDYNAAHRDHFHLEREAKGGSYCR